MDSPSDLFLTNTNYFSWKSHMEYLLISKGLYQFTLWNEQAPANSKKKSKWDNKHYESHGLIRISISPNLWFHLQGIDDPTKSCDKLEVVFGKHNVTQSNQLENHLMYLNPNDFHCIEVYLSKFKILLLLLKKCDIDMKHERCIYVILYNLGSAYYVFLSTFYITKEALGNSYQYPTLDYFCDFVIREQYNFLHLRVISTKSTSNKSLVA